MVNSFSALSQSTASEYNTCRSDRTNDLVITAAVPLTEAFMDNMFEQKIASIDAKDVEPYFEKNLDWRAQVLGGAEILGEHVTGLKVIVSSNQVKITDDDISVYVGHKALHPSITDQRPDGYGDGDEV